MSSLASRYCLIAVAGMAAGCALALATPAAAGASGPVGDPPQVMGPPTVPQRLRPRMFRRRLAPAAAGLPGAAASAPAALPLLPAEATPPSTDRKDAVKSGKTTDSSQAGDKKKQKKKSGGKARGDAPCLAWIEPMMPSRAVIVCVHGLGLYSNSWEQFGKRMSAQGFPTYAIDVRGFGSWMKAKGHQKVNFNACLEDVKTTLKAVRLANPGLPVFLIGESMGGAIALQATALYPDLLDGLISSVPAGERFQQKKTDVKVALHFLSGPNRQFDIGSQIIKQATTCPELKAEWKGDPLDRLKLSARELIQFQLFMNKNHERAREIKNKPVLIVQGCQDKLVKPEGTMELFQELSTEDKQIELIANAEHLIFEEGQFSDATLNMVVSWIEKRLPESPLPAAGEASPLLAAARASFVKGDYDEALSSLDKAVAANPGSSEAHLLLGATQLKLRHFGQARQHLRRAIRLGRGTAQAREANRILMSLPRQFLAPRRGPGTRPLALALARFGPPGPAMQGAPLTGPGGRAGRKLPPARRTAAERQPTVLVFNAGWCEPCQDMTSVIEQAKARFGQRVRFIMVDVDDPSNDELVEQYAVSPVPTVVFLRADGQVADYSVGYAGIDGMVKGMIKILRGA
ncbi:MAG TPA: alpha/beta fold hydrolase [Candidatus Obscuribacterales bacterium]